jgi:hypothetical protein
MTETLAKLCRGSRRRPKIGDVFRLQASSGTILFGVVYHADAYWHNERRGMKLIGVASSSTAHGSESLLFPRANLLTASFLTDSHGWTAGYFEHLYNRPLLEVEENAPSSFANVIRKNVIELRDTRTWELRDDSPVIFNTYSGIVAINHSLRSVISGERGWGDSRALTPSRDRPGWFSGLGSEEPQFYVSGRQRALPPDVCRPTGRSASLGQRDRDR